MKIKISNFGPIDEVAFDLSKDLIVVYGKNNVGKSVSLSVIYLVLKALLDADRKSLIERVKTEVSSFDDTLFEKEIQKKKQVNISGQVNNIFRNIFHSLISEKLEDSFRNTFGSLKSIKNVKSEELPLINLNILNHEVSIKVGERVEITQYKIDAEILGTNSEKQNMVYFPQGENYCINYGNPAQDLKQCVAIFVEKMLMDLFLEIEMKFGNRYFIPASRSGLMKGMQTIAPLFAELSQVRGHLTRKIEIPALSEPYADYILELSKIRGIATDNSHLKSIVNVFEEKILGGEVGFDNEKKQLTYIPYSLESNPLILDMNSVSSMVSELSPLVAFIKYILMDHTIKSSDGPKPVIFIEEPEAHLHPEAQVLLPTIFLELVKAGVKLIISSHSNYIFNKFGNMLIEKTLNAGFFVPYFLENGTDGSVGRPMEVDDLGIEDENFIDIADSLYEERMQILDDLNQKTDDQQSQE